MLLPFSIFNSDTVVKSLKINFFSILAFVSFWCYGYVGAISSSQYGLVGNSIITLTLLLIFVFFYIQSKKNHSLSVIQLSISRTDIFIFTSYFVLFFCFSFDLLTNSLVDDGLAHAKASNMNGYFFIVKIIPQNILELIGQFPCNLAITIFNLCILSAFFIII